MIRLRIAQTAIALILVGLTGSVALAPGPYVLAKMEPPPGVQHLGYLEEIGVTVFEEMPRPEILVGAEWWETDSPASIHDCPNDPLLTKSWHIDAVDLPGAWYHARAHGARVAVIDTGVDCDHPEIVCTEDGIDIENGDSNPADDHGHGTGVAATIGAVAHNGIGTAGSGWGVSIIPIKVADSAGWSTMLKIAVGIIYAADHDASIINISMGGGSYSQATQDAVEYATARGSLVVASSGNYGYPFPVYPAALDNVLSVGATNPDGVREPFSSFGDHLQIMAPGVEIWTVWWPEAEGYAPVSGTSFSAPIVSGVAATIWKRNPLLHPLEISRVITSTAIDMVEEGGPGHDAYTGWGLLDAAQAVQNVPTPRPIQATTQAYFPIIAQEIRPCQPQLPTP